MALEVVDERFESGPSPLAFTAPPPEPKPVDVRILNVISVLAPLLAVRLMVFVAIIISGILTYTILPAPSSASLWALGLYDAFIIIPLIWLASRR